MCTMFSIFQFIKSCSRRLSDSYRARRFPRPPRDSPVSPPLANSARALAPIPRATAGAGFRKNEFPRFRFDRRRDRPLSLLVPTSHSSSSASTVTAARTHAILASVGSTPGSPSSKSATNDTSASVRATRAPRRAPAKRCRRHRRHPCGGRLRQRHVRHPLGDHVEKPERSVARGFEPAR